MPIQYVHEQFSHAFGAFWHSNMGLHLLAALSRSACQNCAAVAGWTQGGCLVAAYGTQRYIASSRDVAATGLRVRLLAVATDEAEAAHVLVALYQDSEERYLDATGMWTREARLGRLEEEYRYDAWSLVP